jgi:hypothetical protein
MNIKDIITESQHKCPHCGGPVVEYSELMEKKDACYYKVKASAKVWPSAYASGRLVQCRKKGAANYGNKNESRGVAEGSAQTYTVLAWKNSTNDSPDVEELDIEAGQARSMAQELKAEGYKVVKIKKQGVTEDFNAEYDDEAGMFKNDLQTIQRVSTHLEKAIYDNENLPEWCQAKIAQAKGMVVAVMDYMISQHENGIVDTVNEQFDLIEEMVLRLAEEHEVDADVIWEDFEAVDDDELYEAAAWQKKSGKNKNGGLNKKGVDSYRREHPGSKLQTAVTTKPSKLKPGSKAAKRRKSFCARMKGMKKHRTGAKTKRDPNSRINKSLRKWNC